ncbi:hypothetical protein PIB30_011872 [Stylosanthes scabra]|uniref:Leucine-rich repeat-containing N-terminal plant-type domain-containing protein n=1 Tax=Stylosanthes scabra TaxID=79078 RepID=A0ABU6U4M2_9FABA|nr:hypothetical protein [Stylosanthes scabra]
MRTNLTIWLYLLLPFSLINFTITLNVATSRCLGHQQSLLLDLKSNLLFNPAKSMKLIHWNHTHDCCQWKGVACSTKGNVIALDISQEFITRGNLTSLFKLQCLQSLNLAYNEFNSDIHYEFQNLQMNLRHLNLSNAGFVGQIPTQISHLNKLETLDLSTSQHGLKLEKLNIVEFLQNFKRMKELYLDGVAIPTKGEEWCHAVSSLKSLQVLSMSSCNLSGPLNPSLTKLQSLSVLQLDNNNLSSPVPEYLANLSSLNILQLRSCRLSGVLPKNIFQLPSLQVLDVSDNQGLLGSLPNFPHQSSLNYLNLSHTNFSEPIPESIGKLNQISTLDLSNCQFNGTLPNSMSNLIHLVHLDLSFNNFAGSLPHLNKSKALRVLSLNHNAFGGMLPSNYLNGLLNLVSIDLGDNSLSGNVPISLFILPSLQLLTLSYNRFDGILEEFPNASSSLLEMIDLCGNNLQGPIPIVSKHHHDVASFPNLNNLLLASCKLRIFPSFLRNLSSLLFLDLSSNQIEGIVPNWIWKFEFMTCLNLSNNFLTHLEGPFSNLSSNLFVLDLHSNQLHGPSPIFTKSITYLDYSNNRFNSFIPADIGNQIPFAVLLYLSNNSFYDKIHESFCQLPYLLLLDLSNNRFSGEIPKCMATNSSSLRVLSLAGNELVGHVPDTFSPSCGLRFLDLNGNLLDGTIPKSLTNCQNLQVLNLRNNQLYDSFPCFLKNISTLRVMILRSNKFYGNVGCPNTIGNNWEMIQIVDLASNNFSGMLPSSLLQSWKALIQDEDRSRFGHLSFYFYDDINTNVTMKFELATSFLSKASKEKLAKIVSIEPNYTRDHLLSHNYQENYSLRRYEDSVTIVNKGQQMKLEKILIAFTSLDFSSNHFEGPIPEEMMSFKALHALNLSHNSFSGHIPSTLGNLRNLESLDLSMNSLMGEIPDELASLSFLAIMNLSYNHLVGRIPTGTQIQSFGADSFMGNEGLCGPPLTQDCGGGGGQGPSAQASSKRSSIDWSLLSVELGFTFGFGIIIMPLILWKRWRLWYSKKVEDVLYKIIPQLDFVYESRGGKRYRSLRWKPY